MYHTYQLTRIQTQVRHILLHQSHLTHQTMSIINKDDLQKRKKINAGEKHFYDPIKYCANLTAKLITAACKPEVVKFKLDEDTLHCQAYLLSFVNLIKILLSQSS